MSQPKTNTVVVTTHIHDKDYSLGIDLTKFQDDPKAFRRAWGFLSNALMRTIDEQFYETFSLDGQDPYA